MDKIILTRVCVNGGFTAAWKGANLPIEAVLSIGKGATREDAIKNLFSQMDADQIRREMMPFEVRHTNDFHPV